jgi:hypothetical protein
MMGDWQFLEALLSNRKDKYHHGLGAVLFA